MTTETKATVIPIRPGYLQGVDPNTNQFTGLDKCAIVLGEIETIKRNLELIKEAGADALQRIADAERKVHSIELEQILAPGESQDIKRRLATAVAELTGMKEAHRDLLTKISTAEGAILSREEALPALRSEERNLKFEAARVGLIEELPAVVERARAALVELMVYRAIEYRCSPGLVDVQKVAAQIAVEQPIRELAWDLYVKKCGVSPL